jgi:hypothetical protein
MPKVLTVGVTGTNYEGRAIFLHTSNLVISTLHVSIYVYKEVLSLRV